jgi:hypothetical protein
MKQPFIALMILGLALAVVSAAGAAQRLVEQFDYATGDLTTVGSPEWTAHSVPGTNPQQVVASSLSYPGLTGVSGGAVTFINTGEDDSRIYTAGITSAETTAYFSAVVSIATAGAGDYFLHFIDGAPSFAFHGRLFVRDSAGSAEFGIRYGSGDTVQYGGAPATVAYNTPTFIVVKVTSVVGVTNDTADLFVNPGLDIVEPLPTVTATQTDVGQDYINLNAIAIRQGTTGNNVTGSVDTIRVGTLWGDVDSSVAPVELSLFTAN